MSVITHALHRLRLNHLSRPLLAFLIVWLLAMIMLPIARWIWGDAATPAALSIAVVAQVALVIAILRGGWSLRRVVLTVAAVMALGWLVEYIGSTTGFPFGEYDYTARLQPQLGKVPLLIPLAWLMMLPPSWAVGFAISAPLSERPLLRRAAMILISGLALTAWDLFLDPMLVSWDFWRWAEPSGYFGIPWVNFAGWILSAAVITALVMPRDVPRRPLLVIYGATWFFMTGGLAFFWGLLGPAIVGSLAMGTLLILALRQTASLTQR